MKVVILRLHIDFGKNDVSSSTFVIQVMLREKHHCQISNGTRKFLFYPGENDFKKFVGYLRLSFMVSDKSRAARRYLKSQAYITDEKRRHLRYYSHIIHPFSMFRHWWDILMIFVIGTALICIPYQAAFNVTEHCYWVWIIVKNALILICWTDILINFLTGYLDMSQGFIELRQSRILHRYVKHGTFVADLLGSLPTDAFFVTRWYELTVARELSSLIYVLRVFSMCKYVGNVAYAYDVPRASYEFFAMLFWLLLVMHWQSCVYWIVPITAVSLLSPSRPKDESWVNTLKLWENPNRRLRYLQCVHRAFSTFSRLGLRSTEPRTSEDQFTVIFFQLLCTLIFCFLVAKMLQFVKTISSAEFKYHANMVKLKQYIKHKQLPRHTQNRFITHYEYKFQQRYLKETEVIGNISMQMRQEIRMHSCRKLVENVVFFQNLPLPMLVRIVSLLHSEIYLTNDVIVRVNQIGDCMYFIATGTVAVYTGSGKEVCHLESGAHFGEIALVMPNERRVASVVAVEVCKLYRLERADFIRTIHPYPLLWEQIKKIAYERVERTTILNAQ